MASNIILSDLTVYESQSFKRTKVAQAVTITAIALVAIGAATIGILSLQQIANFGQMGLIGGLTLAAGGPALLLIDLALTALFLYKAHSKAPEFTPPLYPRKELKSSDFENFTEAFNDKTDAHRGTLSLEKYLQRLYGKALPPDLRNPSPENVEKRLDLVLCESVLNLELSAIRKYDQEEIEILCDRLTRDESHFTTRNQKDLETLEGLPNPTLKQLRQLKGEKLHEQLRLLQGGKELTEAQLKSEHYFLLGLLTPKQIERILKEDSKKGDEEKLDKDIFDKILPPGYYTRVLFRYVKPKVLCNHVATLPGAQLKLFPNSLFNHPEFPWLDFFARKEGILQEELFPIEGFAYLLGENTNIEWSKLEEVHIQHLFGTKTEGEETRTAQILQNLKMGAIKDLAKNLNAVHIRLFSAAQLTHPDFPWAEFLKKGNVVDEIFKIEDYKSILREAALPWDSEDEEKIIPALQALLVLSFDNGRTKEIVRHLKMTSIQAVAPHLDAGHLPLFATRQLKDSKFPWAEFFKKKDVGSRLLEIEGREAVLRNPKIPWADLPQDEVDKLFAKTDVFVMLDEPTRREIILQNLPITAIAKLGEKLQVEYFPHFATRQLLDNKFPWAEFFKKEHVGFRLLEIEGREAVLRNPKIPWADLPQGEVDKLLPNDKEATGTILQNFPVSSIKALGDKLNVEYLSLFTTQQLIHRDFPWKELCTEEVDTKPVFKEGALSFLLDRTDLSTILVRAHFEWEHFKDKQIQFIFPNTGTFTDRNRKVLNQLPTEKIQAFLPGLFGDHIPLLTKGQCLKLDAHSWMIVLSKWEMANVIERWAEAPSILSHSKIPWEAIMTSADDAQSSNIGGIFKPESSQSIAILQKLHVSNIRHLAPHLDVGVLGSFTDGQLCSKDFPWDAFVKRGEQQNSKVARALLNLRPPQDLKRHKKIFSSSAFQVHKKEIADAVLKKLKDDKVEGPLKLHPDLKKLLEVTLEEEFKEL